MKKRFLLAILSLTFACSLCACGKKEAEEQPTTEATTEAVQDDIVSFVNDSLPAIESQRESAVGIYNSYFVDETPELETFLNALTNQAIPQMEDYIVALTAIDTKSTETSELKSLYIQSAQKQHDAMQMVATAIENENPEYLSQANDLIREADNYITQFETKLSQIATQYNIRVNGQVVE